MKKTLTILFASSAITAAIGVPAWSAMQTPPDGFLRPFTALFEAGTQAMPLVLASDDDDDEDRAKPEGSRRRHGDDDDDDDDDDRRGGAPNPAPAGTVAPPQNGLFGNGAPPQVKVQ